MRWTHSNIKLFVDTAPVYHLIVPDPDFWLDSSWYRHVSQVFTLDTFTTWILRLKSDFSSSQSTTNLSLDCFLLDQNNLRGFTKVLWWGRRWRPKLTNFFIQQYQEDSCYEVLKVKMIPFQGQCCWPFPDGFLASNLYYVFPLETFSLNIPRQPTYTGNF